MALKQFTKKKLFYFLVIICVIYMFLNGNFSPHLHPVWTTLPFVFSILCIPSIAVFSLIEMIKSIIRVLVEDENININSFIKASIIIPLIIFMVCIAFIYYYFTK
jgi:hypothetical protein